MMMTTTSLSPAIDPHRLAIPSSTTPEFLLLKPNLSNGFHKVVTPTVKACIAEAEPCKIGSSGRREALVGVGAFIGTYFSLSGEALAAKAPKGFQSVLDNNDGYQFLYPFGWQEIAVKGQDVVFKDVIEPLENVSVSVIDTDKSDMHDLGSPEEVANALVSKVLSSPSQKTQLLEAKERVAEGKTYYTFEFLAKAPNYTRHALGTVAISNGKFFTLSTGANERRWGKMQDKLRTVANSFTLLN